MKKLIYLGLFGVIFMLSSFTNTNKISIDHLPDNRIATVEYNEDTTCSYTTIVTCTDGTTVNVVTIASNCKLARSQHISALQAFSGC